MNFSSVPHIYTLQGRLQGDDSCQLRTVRYRDFRAIASMSLESSVDSSLQVPHRAIELYYGLQALHTAAPARAGREEKWLRTGHGVLAHWRRENSDAYRKGKTGPGFDPLEKVPN